MQPKILTAEALTSWLVARVAEARQIEPRSVDVDERFSHHGLDSLGASALVAQLSEVVGRPLSPTLVWEAPTIRALVRHLTGASSATAAPAEAPEERDAREPIAVVGMACRFPGAPDLDAFWRLLRDGVDAVAEVPDDRGWDELLTARGVEPAERAKVRRGGFLDRIDGFDPLFFGISPREATAMDPQQRLVLELAWEALEDARIRPSSLRGSSTGVFAGAVWSDYVALELRHGAEGLGQYTTTGWHHSIIANRISYVLGLMGPSLTLDTACSSALVAAHLACESLRRGECTLALAGAVNLNITAESALGVARFGALSQDGRCYTFDARANGYVRGEGAGMLVLKPLGRAIADGDPIACVIRGSAVNSDGASNGLTAPNPAAQEAVLRAAYRRAGVEPSSVQYVEAHGTGTPLGDPIEAGALGAVLGEGRPADAPLLVGSAKTNIGHLEAAAGTVGMIKAALAIKHRLLPPSINFATPNPHAPLAELRIAVPTELRPWPAPDRLLTAGISSFGFGGTNGHVVMQEWPAPRSELFPLSAESPEALGAEVERLRAALPRDAGRTALAALAADAASRCRPALHRLSVVATSAADLDRKLAAQASSPQQHPTDGGDGARGVVFVFPGLGAHWFGMARSLIQGEPVFRAALEACDVHVRRHLGLSLVAELTRGRAAARLDDVEVSLPAIISIDIAVAAWWRSLGVEPAAVVGHSAGEIAAAHVAGALDLDDAMRVVCAYGRVLARLDGQGAMALAALPWAEAGAAIARFEGRVFRAIEDSAGATVLAGEPPAIAALTEELAAKGVFCRRVSTNVAPHSPMVDALRADLLALIQDIRPRRGSVPIVSEVTGGEIDGAAIDAAHCVKNFAEQVRFSTAVDALIARGHRVFLDVGPHPITARSVETNLRRAGAHGVVLASLRRDEDERRTLLEALGALHALGAPVRWSGLYPAADERSAVDARASLLPLSARSAGALSSLAAAYAERLRAADEGGRFADFAYAASTGREHHPHRLAVVGRSREEVSDRLSAFAGEGAADRVVHGAPSAPGRPKVVFVFSGQGSQWTGMGRQLLAEEPVFRAKLEECDALLRRHVPWSLLDELGAPEERSRLDRTEVVQPALFAIEVGIAALLASWGVTPDAVIGHSVGEVAAAHVAGALSLPEALRLVAWRGRVMQKATGLGKMASAALSPEDAAKAIAGREARLAVAAINDPGSVVLSGDPDALDAVVAAMSARGVECKALKVAYAFHSPQMDPLARELVQALGRIERGRASIRLYSTVTGAPVDGEALDATYWGRNVREPVQLARAVASALGDGHALYLEIGPHPVLWGNLRQCVASQEVEGHVLFTLRRQSDERVTMLEALAALYARGVDVAWRALHPSGGRLARLPTYPWQRERYWVDAAAPAGGARAPRGGHPLLGVGLSPADRPETTYWEQWVSAVSPAFLADHRLQGQVIFPGAGYVEMALAAASEVYGEGRSELEAISFEWMLALGERHERRLQVSLVDQGRGRASVVVARRAHDAGTWVRHAHATVREAGEDAALPAEPPRLTLERCPTELPGTAHYARMEERRIQYGPAFQGVKRIWVGAGEVLGQVRLPEAAGHTAAYQIHPALLDACFQVCAALVGERRDSLVPVRIDRVRVHRRSWRKAWVRATHVAGAPEAESEAAMDLAIVDDEGRPLLEIAGLHMRRFATAIDPFDDCAHVVTWRPKPLAAPRAPAQAPAAATWLIFTDAGGVGAAVAERLRGRGDACIEVAAGARFERRGPHGAAIDPSSPEDYQRLFREIASGDVALRGVVHAFGLDAAPWEATTAETLPADVRRGSVSALYVVQELTRQSSRDAPRLLLVTRGAQAVEEFASRLAVSQAALWGLGRTIAAEHPELACTRIDLDPTPGPDEAASLVQELVAGDGEDQIALRGGRRLVARLERGSFEPAEAATFDAGGSYLITGGLGGLGLTAARWLVASGARHVLLLGRNDPSDQAREAIRAMTDAGAEVQTRRADVARAADVEDALAYLGAHMPALRGIIHAAGVLEDRTLQQMSAEELMAVVRPKVVGAWNLHAATRDLPLDFFVTYSSAAALLGTPGQGNYAAANAFLDALAHGRAADGLPAMSIQWGPFSEVGLAAAQENRGQRLAHRGIESFTPEEGTEVLSRLIRQPWGDIGVLRWSVRQWVEFYPRAASAPFLSLLRKAEERAGAAGAGSRFLDTLRGVPPIERRAALERHVVERLGQALRLAPEQIDVLAPLRGYGMDSLMSLEIRNRLEASLTLRLPATLLFTYPTTAALVDHLLAELHMDAAMDESNPGVYRVDEGAREDLSESVAVAMLNAKLSEFEDYLK
jgi:acyl transferase domain-containing protein/acyl carrier protein